MKQGEKVEPMLSWAEQIERAKVALRKAKQGSAADLFGKALAEGGVPAAAEKKLMARRPDGPVFEEGDFNALGYQLVQENKLESALFVFEEKTVPSSTRTPGTPGTASVRYRPRREKGPGHRVLPQSLELNPKNKNGRAMLRRLEKGQ